MLKSRNSWFVLLILVLIALGGVWYVAQAGQQESLPSFPATIQRDCAPWDGSAFTVSIPVKGSSVLVSIYQSPDIQRPLRFTFPDDTGQVGNASLVSTGDSFEELTGTVSFQRVDPGKPVQGEFDLVTEKGQHFKGTFIAEWNDQPIYCG